MIQTETRYLVHFDGLGYYAAKQPNYEWSFTHDMNEAQMYKTIKKAQDRIDHNSCLTQPYPTGSIHVVEAVTSITLISKGIQNA